MRGGIPQPRFDQIHNPPAPPTPTGSAAGTFRGRLVVVFGTGRYTGVFVYSPVPGPGNLVASVASAAGTDPYGNSYVEGFGTYGPTATGQLDQGALLFSYAGQFSSGSVSGTGSGPGALLNLDSGLGSGADLNAVVTLFSQQNAGRGVLIGSGASFRQMATALEVADTIGMHDHGSDPATPTSGGILYCKAGALFYRGSSGTITPIAPA